MCQLISKKYIKKTLYTDFAAEKWGVVLYAGFYGMSVDKFSLWWEKICTGA